MVTCGPHGSFFIKLVDFYDFVVPYGGNLTKIEKIKSLYIELLLLNRHIFN